MAQVLMYREIMLKIKFHFNSHTPRYLERNFGSPLYVLFTQRHYLEQGTVFKNKKSHVMNAFHCEAALKIF